MWNSPDLPGGLFLLTAWFALENGWQPLLAALLAAALHELGHLAALLLFRAPVYALHLQSLGAVLETDRSRLSYRQELMVLLAGPAVNLVCGVLLSRSAGGRALPAQMAGAHLLLGLLNLLPVRKLDGGQILQTLLAWWRGPGTGDVLCTALSRLCALGLCALLAAVMICSGGSLWLLPAIPAILACA